MEETKDIIITRSPSPPKKKQAIQCEVCQECISKYKCPSCSTRSCSVECVKKHKEETNCTGKKECTFLTVSSMNDDTLRSDYFFLKEVERLAGDSFQSTKRNTQNKKRRSKGDQNKEKDQNDEKEEEGEIPKLVKTPLPAALKKLINEANSRGVSLRLMPKGMSKRDCNTTFFAYRSKKFFWRVEWLFNQFKDKENHVTLVSSRIDDGDNILSSLESILESIKNTSNSGESGYSIYQRKELREKLKACLSIDAKQLCLLMKVENLPADQNQYYLLNNSLSLFDNFQGKTIIEFPTILVVHPDNLIHFTIYQDSVN